jgi:hypothetical protein
LGPLFVGHEGGATHTPARFLLFPGRGFFESDDFFKPVIFLNREFLEN